ncbi:MAG TPA: hypothetical protein VFG14_09390 [Chthoniobacteraceae bacterium]|nr:hypothetical protein [Chthoniobacteraceae bacterium]
MKRTFLSLLLLVLSLQARADDSAYRTTLDAAHQRFQALEIKRSDYRKPKAELPAAEEEERRRLLGHLLTDDPVWALTQQLQTDIEALAAARPRTPVDANTMEDLKDLLAFISGFADRATTLAQAEQLAAALRQFVVRRDLPGIRQWAKSQ